MRQALEREVKLQVPPGFALPPWPGTPIGPRRFTSTYFDTEDFRLAAAGITLRRRVEGRRALWQLKIPRKGARLELEESGGSLRPPKSFLRLLVAPLRGRALAPVAKLRTLRTGTVVADESRRVAEVVYDSVQVLDDRTVVDHFSELEVELLEGGEQDLVRLASELKSLGAFPDERPKLFRVLNMNTVRAEPKIPGTSDLARLQDTIVEQFRLLVHHDPGIRLGDEPEDLHQHRVGVRRLRSLLGSARMLEPQWARFLRSELEWVGDLMNSVRDLDVMIPHLRADLKRLTPGEHALVQSLIDRLVADREAARLSMIEGLESERYLALLDALEAATVALVVRPVEDDLAAGAARRFNKLRRAVEALSNPVRDEELHRVRRLVKKARYTADLVKSAGGEKVAAYLTDLKVIQDVLGDFQDAVVAENRIARYLPRVKSPPEAFALGRLAELQAVKKRGAVAAFPAAWRKAAKSGRKAWG